MNSPFLGYPHGKPPHVGMPHTGVSKEVGAVLYLHLIFMAGLLSALQGRRINGFWLVYTLWFLIIAMENHCF